MSNFNRLQILLDKLESRTVGKMHDSISGLNSYYKVNGSLTDKQLVFLTSLIRQFISQEQAVEQFELMLKEFFKEPSTREAFRLIS